MKKVNFSPWCLAEISLYRNIKINDLFCLNYEEEFFMTLKNNQGQKNMDVYRRGCPINSFVTH